MNVGLGALIAVAAGAINGLFAAPMKAAPKWAWENFWLPFSVLALGVFPWIIAARTVPNLAAFLHEPLLIPLLWGVAIYTGSLLFGISLARIGTSLAFALLVGSMSIVGVLGPIAAFHPEILGAAGGKSILAGIFCLLIALVVCAIAGARKARAQARSGSAVTGMLLAILGGVLSGLLSLGMAMNWARDLSAAAVHLGGATPAAASNAVLLPVLMGGAIPNCLYCLYLLNRNHTWIRYRETSRAWLIVLLMAVMYSGSVALWGISTSPAMLGKLGPSVGWALFIGTMVLSSNVGGFLTGEWKDAEGAPARTMAGGLALIVAAMALIGYGNYLLN